MIKDAFLDKLVASGKIVKFYRSTGWVFIGRDKVRGNGGTYAGPERRGRGAGTAV